jgi:transposase, IS5 family
MDDQHGFILHSEVMSKSIDEQLALSQEPSMVPVTDENITVSFVEEALKEFKNINSVSLDKGFYTPDNKEKLENIISESILPKKGKLSQQEKEEQNKDYFVQGRKKHPGI